MKQIIVALAVIAAVTSGEGAATAASTTYTWSVDGSIANSGLPAGLAPGIRLGPNVSHAKDGTRLEIAGAGRFTPNGHWIDGGGDYRVLDSGGNVLASGRWRPTSLQSYRDLGTEPEGSPVESLRSGIFVAPIVLEGPADSASIAGHTIRPAESSRA